MDASQSGTKPVANVKAVNLNDKASRNPREEEKFREATVQKQRQLPVAPSVADVAESSRVNGDTAACYCRRSEGC